jgi:hypothetical protein
VSVAGYREPEVGASAAEDPPEPVVAQPDEVHNELPVVAVGERVAVEGLGCADE